MTQTNKQINQQKPLDSRGGGGDSMSFDKYELEDLYFGRLCLCLSTLVKHSEGKGVTDSTSISFLFFFLFLFILLSYLTSWPQFPLPSLLLPFPPIHSSISLQKAGGLPGTSTEDSIASYNKAKHTFSYKTG